MEQEKMLKLLSAVALGDQQSFSELYSLTSARLYAVSIKLLKRRELAEEALQEAFVRIWHNASQYQQGQGTVITWMISIVRYRALDMLRYNKVRNEQALNEQEEDPTLEPELMTMSEQALLDKCMDELDAQQKQAIHLAYFNGLTHHEVVQHMDSPLGTIKSWIRRGLLSLQRCLTV